MKSKGTIHDWFAISNMNNFESKIIKRKIQKSEKTNNKCAIARDCCYLITHHAKEGIVDD